MKKTLTFDFLMYSFGSGHYELRFADRRISFKPRNYGSRLMVNRMAKLVGVVPTEMKGYIQGLREIRRLVKRNVRNLERVKWFCTTYRDQLSTADPGYIQALKDVEKIMVGRPKAVDTNARIAHD